MIESDENELTNMIIIEEAVVAKVKWSNTEFYMRHELNQVEFNQAPTTWVGSVR